jgi:hypothetical protein
MRTRLELDFERLELELRTPVTSNGLKARDWGYVVVLK